MSGKYIKDEVERNRKESVIKLVWKSAYGEKQRRGLRSISPFRKLHNNFALQIVGQKVFVHLGLFLKSPSNIFLSVLVFRTRVKKCSLVHVYPNTW
jgi:hypothetical protein